MPALLRSASLVLVFALWSMPARADPLVFFLMSAAREIISSAADRPAPKPLPLPEEMTLYPGTAVRPVDMRRVIDESFVYLSSDQRTEIFDSLHAMLLDAKLGASRATLIEYFMHKALAVRVAQVQLERLSQADKRELAVQFRQEIAALPDEERGQLQLILQKNLLPVPADLNQLLLAELKDVR